MRILILTGLLTLAPTAQAQNYSSEMRVTVPEVEVRSGPTAEYYVTGKLKFNDTVSVLHESEQQKGWLAIRPPTGSFSWINEKNVKIENPSTGYVTIDEAPLRPGSLVYTKDPRPVESVKIKKGSIVGILGKGKAGPDGETWLPIQPWITEVRFIPADAVLNRQPGSSPGPVPSQLASSSQNQWNPGLAAQQNQSRPWPPAQTASFSQSNVAAKNISYPPTWSQVGILRRSTSFDKDGQPTYALEDAKGRVLLYINCQAGFSLQSYVGRNVSLYGAIVYRSDDYLRTHLMQATHVALY